MNNTIRSKQEAERKTAMKAYLKSELHKIS